MPRRSCSTSDTLRSMSARSTFECLAKGGLLGTQARLARAEGLGLVRNTPLGLVGAADPDLELAEEAEQLVLAAEAGLELGQHAEEVGDLAAGAVDQVTLLLQGGELLGGLLGEGAEDADLVLHLGQALALLPHGAHDARWPAWSAPRWRRASPRRWSRTHRRR